MAKKLITLAKELDFQTEAEFFDYCIDSHINGNFSQCKELFKSMSKADQKELLLHIERNFVTGFSDKEIYNFYFNLL